jgi:hypothetical protein
VEDVRAYEDMRYETFKLLEPGIHSEDLLKSVRAYGERRFEGNLEELVLPYGFREPPMKQKIWIARPFLRALNLNA